MEQNEFLKGLKQGKTCENYAIKFKNTYVQYIEKENLKRKDFIFDHSISDLEFEAQYLDDWNSKWFYIGQDIISFYNAMNWDFKELSSSKKALYSPDYDTNYKNYVIQDIWDNLLNETDSETVCWGVYNFISILQNTDEQQSLKNDLQTLMDELYQFVPDETKTSSEGKLSEYIKENKGIECAFGHIEIAMKDRLGQGGNGIVYSGTLEGTSVAVKFLVNYTKDKLKRFMAEYLNVRIASQKLHHAVNYLHYETLQLGDVKIPCIIMEKYSSSLKQYRKNMQQITWEDLIKLFHDLCDALKSLEASSIIHRDLKPENILIDDNGNYILTDFGIAHFESDKYPIKGLTKKHDRMANWEFCAPEQVMGGEISSATDIYALGQILYWFCFNTINRGHGGEHLTSLFDNDKAAILDNIIYKSILNNPDDRYQKIEEIEAYYADSCKKSPDVYDDMHTFSEAIRSVIPEAYSKPYNTNNKEIIIDLIKSLNKSSFNRDLYYNTGFANDSFSSIKYLENGNYLLNEREITIEEIWAMVDTRVYSDLLLLKISNPKPYVVNGKKTSSIAIINKSITEPLDMVASGYYRFSDGHVESVNKLDIETRHIYDDSEKYIVIGPYKNCSMLPKNDSIIFNLQEQEPLIPDFISDLKRQLSKNKADEVLLGI